MLFIDLLFQEHQTTVTERLFKKITSSVSRLHVALEKTDGNILTNNFEEECIHLWIIIREDSPENTFIKLQDTPVALEW